MKWIKSHGQKMKGSAQTNRWVIWSVGDRAIHYLGHYLPCTHGPGRPWLPVLFYMYTGINTIYSLPGRGYNDKIGV